jgi:hypothetical protein
MTKSRRENIVLVPFGSTVNWNGLTIEAIRMKSKTKRAGRNKKLVTCKVRVTLNGKPFPLHQLTHAGDHAGGYRNFGNVSLRFIGTTKVRNNKVVRASKQPGKEVPTENQPEHLHAARLQYRIVQSAPSHQQKKIAFRRKNRRINKRAAVDLD